MILKKADLKLSLFDLTEFTVLKLRGLRHCNANQSLWKRLNFL